MTLELQLLLTNLWGWFRFWLLPKLWSAVIVVFVAYLLVRWLDGRWYNWLRPILISARNRSASQSVWRQVRILSLPRTLTRIVVAILAGWVIFERFGVPREVILWGLTVVVASFLWGMRHLFSDLTAGYSLVLDDTLAEGDQISSPLGEGVVERISWFAVYLRTDEGTLVVIPHRAVKNTVIKVRRLTSNVAKTMQ